MLIHDHDTGYDEDRRDEITNEDSLSEAFAMDKLREDFAQKDREEEGGEEVRDLAHDRHHSNDWDDEKAVFEE